MGPCLVQIGDIGIVVLHDGADEVLLVRKILTIVMVPPDNDGLGQVGQALEEVMGDFIARGVQDVLMMEDVSRNNDETRFCLNGNMGTEFVKEGIKHTSIFIFTTPFCISCPNMDIG